MVLVWCTLSVLNCKLCVIKCKIRVILSLFQTFKPFGQKTFQTKVFVEKLWIFVFEWLWKIFFPGSILSRTDSVLYQNILLPRYYFAQHHEVSEAQDLQTDCKQANKLLFLVKRVPWMNPRLTNFLHIFSWTHRMLWLTALMSLQKVSFRELLWPPYKSDSIWQRIQKLLHFAYRFALSTRFSHWCWLLHHVCLMWCCLMIVGLRWIPWAVKKQ